MSAFPSADQPLPHFVSTAPFDPQSIGRMTPEQEKAALASQWRLMWIKFRRHRLAVWSGAFLVFIYLVALFCEPVAPYGSQTRNTDFVRAPPQAVHLFHEGRFVGPFVYGYQMKLDLDTLRRDYVVDRQRAADPLLLPGRGL